ncbi:MAG TPA: ParA family protein, partial [Stellaceae bacterium]|nr:ParA family protein [Stellaceae bacterium]
TGEPAGAALIEATSPPRPEPPAAARRPAEDPADAVLNEIYPPAAEPAAAPTAEAEPRSAGDPAAEEPAAEAAAVIADIQRIGAGDPAPASSEESVPAVDEPAAAATPEPETARRRGAGRRRAAAGPMGGDGNPPVEAAPGGFPAMFVIAVASQKGGAGKTTIAAHLAVRAGIAGHGPVVLIDTDPQGSLAEWWHARSDDTPALAVVTPQQLGANLAELRGYGTAVAIIDTPPALTGAIEQVIAMADLIVVPVRPSPHDLRAAGGTVEMARRAGKPFVFVVNGAAPRAGITAQAVAALSEHGRVAPVILYQRTEYAASMIDGRTVMEAAASGRSAQEIAELWRCVSAQIGVRAAA